MRWVNEVIIDDVVILMLLSCARLRKGILWCQAPRNFFTVPDIRKVYWGAFPPLYWYDFPKGNRELGLTIYSNNYATLGICNRIAPMHLKLIGCTLVAKGVTIGEFTMLCPSRKCHKF